VSATLRWTCRLSFPAFAVIAGLAPQIVEYIYSPKWRPALPVLYLLLASAALSSVVGVLVSALYSLGRGAAGLRIAAVWTGLTWVIGVLLAIVGEGFEGLGLAFLAGTVVALLLTLYEIRDLDALRLAGEMLLPALSGVIVAVGLYLLAPAVVHSLWSFLLVGFAAGVVGLAANVMGERSMVWAAIKSLASDFSSAQPAPSPGDGTVL
jgi:O-antigen/teichoic acid export membrane protein